MDNEVLSTVFFFMNISIIHSKVRLPMNQFYAPVSMGTTVVSLLGPHSTTPGNCNAKSLDINKPRSVACGAGFSSVPLQALERHGARVIMAGCPGNWWGDTLWNDTEAYSLVPLLRWVSPIYNGPLSPGPAALPWLSSNRLSSRSLCSSIQRVYYPGALDKREAGEWHLVLGGIKLSFTPSVTKE